MAAVSPQLSLALSLREEATFGNFWISQGSVRAEISQLLQGGLSSQEPFVYLWGSSGSGRSHLLQASCHSVLAEGGSAQYLPLPEMVAYDARGVLENLDSLDLVCLQGMDAICGLPGWEAAIFDLFNRLRDKGNRLIVSAEQSPRSLHLALSDLKSRLSYGLVYHLLPYEDREKEEILKFRASRLGLELTDEVSGFILNRSKREMVHLLDCLRRLDVASLQAQRRLTIPFVKETFGW